MRTWEQHRHAAVEGGSAMRSGVAAIGATVVAVALGVWAITTSDSVVRIFGGVGCLAGLAFAALCLSNAARFRRGERPTA